METPGISLRPLMTAGGSTEFSEMILEDVRIPVANRVGAESDGWRIAMVTFAFERGTGFVAEVARGRRARGGRRAVPRERHGEGLVRRRYPPARTGRRVRRPWALVKRNVSEASSADGVPGAGASVFKLGYSESRQQLGDLHAEVRGRLALAFERRGSAPTRRPGYERLRSLAYTIAAGTSQMQRNIIGERPPRAAQGTGWWPGRPKETA